MKKIYLAPAIDAKEIVLQEMIAASPSSVPVDPTKEGDASLSPAKESFWDGEE